MQATSKRRRIGTTQRRQLNIAIGQQEAPLLDYFNDTAEDRDKAVATWVKETLWMAKDFLELGIEPDHELRLLILRVVSRGWDDHIFESYIGHAPPTMSRKHYAIIDDEEKIRLMRENVTDRVDTLVQETKTERPS